MKVEVGIFDVRFGFLDCGLRPLRAVGSIYEPEAVGAIRAYAPEGMWEKWGDWERPVIRYRMPGSGCQMPDTRCKVPDIGVWLAQSMVGTRETGRLGTETGNFKMVELTSRRYQGIAGKSNIEWEKIRIRKMELLFSCVQRIMRCLSS